MNTLNPYYEHSPDKFEEIQYKELIRETFGSGGGAYLIEFHDNKKQWIPKKCCVNYPLKKTMEIVRNFYIKNNLHYYKAVE